MSTPDDLGPEPHPSDFLVPDEPQKSKRTLLSVVAALTVLVMVAVTVISIFIWMGDDNPAPGNASPEETAQIAEAAQRYVAAVNVGVAANYLDALCQTGRESLEGLADTVPADPQMTVIDVTNVNIDGDTASAAVSIVPEQSTSATPRIDRLQFRNEGGWKYCGLAR